MTESNSGEYLREMADQGYDPDSIGSFHLTMIPWLAKKCGVGPKDLIIDVGSAQGHCVLSAYKAGYSNLAVVDVDPHNFELFSNRYGIRCQRADIEHDRLSFQDSEASLIMCVHLIEHLHETGLFLSEARRVLGKSRAIALVTPDWRKQYKTFWRDPTHVHPYDRESIARLLRMHGFRHVQTYAWGSAYGLGRIGAYRLWPQLGLIGRDLLSIGFNPD